MNSRNILLCLCLLAPVMAPADAGPATLITDGKPLLELRYRYEHVDQDTALDNADANTVRARAGFQSGIWQGWSALMEVDHVQHLGGERFNDTRNGRGSYALVPDPDGTEVNQALLRYTHNYGSATLGRQRIGLDNQRFIGAVAWRQNEQTYDAFLARLTAVDDLVITYAYLDNVNTPFGPEGQHGYPTNPANIDGHSHLLHLAYAAHPLLHVSLYHYALGMNNLAVAPAAALGTQSSRTAGLRATGHQGAFRYALEYANQRDYRNNPLDIDADYYLAELSWQRNGYLARIGHEVLGAGEGPGNTAFQTPLATKHLFQGWADLFLITPAQGIRDTYAGGSVPLLGGSLQGWYHDFRADEGGSRYGTEVDIAYSRKITPVPGLSAMVKFARYSADDLAVDTDKFWVQVQYSY